MLKGCTRVLQGVTGILPDGAGPTHQRIHHTLPPSDIALLGVAVRVEEEQR
jgi:hypothetical protein